MDSLRILTFIAVCSSAFAKIKIDDLIVPAQLQHGQTDYVILDCKFQVENRDDTTGLVIKWFFQKYSLVYQWFPGRAPEASSSWKNRIDLGYSVSNDPNTKHRALKITNITTDITGEYTCKVSSDFNEASSAKTMVIYEPPKTFDFDHFENSSQLSCSANEVFPKPVLNIYTRNINLTNLDEREDYDIQNDISLDEEDDVEEVHGFYNVTSSFRYNPSEITQPVEFICELTIPNTSFSKVSRKVIGPEEETTTTTTSQYDYETTTIQSIVSPANSGSSLCWNLAVLYTASLIVLKQYL